jgi:hypothetical protein
MRPARATQHAVGVALAALLAALVACFAANAQSAGGVAATITVLEGQAEVVPPGSSTPIPARVDLRVMPGSTVRTKANGRVELQFDDRSLLRLDHNTEIQILGGPQERGVMVSLGNIWAKVQSVFGASKFKVKTPTVVAGVRGTILRAEVSDDEASIAVDEGEVEVTPEAGGPATIVKQNHELRARRGGMTAPPTTFSPEARQRWEFWTDPLVQQQIQSIHEAAAASKQACADVHRRTWDISEALALDTQAAWRLGQCVKGANGLVASVQAALSLRSQAGHRRLVYVPALRAKLNAAEQQYAEYLPLARKGQDALQQHVADVQDLREALAAQQDAERELMQRLKAFRDRREVDPHWQAFRPHCEESEAYGDRVRQTLGECSPLLSPDVPADLGNDPQVLRTIQQRFVWTSRVLERLPKQIADGQAEVARLQELLKGMAEGPMRPAR